MSDDIYVLDCVYDCWEISRWNGQNKELFIIYFFRILRLSTKVWIVCTLRTPRILYNVHYKVNDIIRVL